MRHNAWAEINEIARRFCGFLVDCVNAFNFAVFVIDQIRHGV